MAINPTNPEHVIATFIQSTQPGQQPRSTNWAYVSTDGGLTWTGTMAANPSRRVQGDDVIAFGRDGTAFHTYIAFDGIRVDRPEVAATGIWVRRTRDGVTWDPAVPVIDHVNTVMPFEDKPWTIVDRAADSPHRGNVYVAWTRFDVYGSDDPAHRSTIWFARSRDGGQSFQPPTRISDDTGDAKDGDGTLEGAVPAVGPEGRGLRRVGRPQGAVVRSLGRWRLDVRRGQDHLAADRRLGHPGPRRRAAQRHAGDRGGSQQRPEQGHAVRELHRRAERRHRRVPAGVAGRRTHVGARRCA